MEHEEDESMHAFHAENAFGTGELPQGALMSVKVPPGYDGRGSWFAYEELVLDWEDSATLDKKLRGLALKNRVYGDATVYKPMLDRDTLKDEWMTS